MKKTTYKNQRQTVESILRKIKDLLSSSDIGRLLSLFLELSNTYTSNKPDSLKSLQDIEDIFKIIEGKIRWQKDPRKNQGKLYFYKNMAQVYVESENPKALGCIQTSIRRFMSYNTAKNYADSDEALNTIFNEGAEMARALKKTENYVDLCNFIISTFEDKSYPRDTDLFESSITFKAEYLRSQGDYEACLELERFRHIYRSGVERCTTVSDTVEYFKTVSINKAISIITSMYSKFMCYHNMNNAEKCFKLCEGTKDMILLFHRSNIWENVEKMPSIIKRINCETFYYKALSMSQLNKDTEKVKEAWEEYIVFRNQMCSEESGEVYNRMDYSSLYLHGEKYTHDQILGQLKGRLAQADKDWAARKDIKELIATIETFKDIIKAIKKLGLVTQGSLQLFIKASYSMMDCVCKTDCHVDVIRMVERGLIPAVLKIYNKEKVITYDDLMKKKAVCYMHLLYLDEAIEVIENLSNPDELAFEYIQILLFRKKFKKALEMLAKNPHHRLECMAHLLNKDEDFDYFPSKENSNVKDGVLVLDKAEGYLFIFNTVYDMRRCKQVSQAVQFMETLEWHQFDKRKDVKAIWIGYCVMNLELTGSSKVIVQDMEKAINEPKTLLKMTSAFFNSIDPSDSMKFIKKVERELRKEKGSKKLKKAKTEVNHFCNSMSIDLLFRKKLKQNVSDYIFRIEKQ